MHADSRSLASAFDDIIAVTYETRIAPSDHTMKVSIIGGGGLVGSCTGLRPANGRSRPRDRAARRQRRSWPPARRSTCCTARRVMADQVITSGGYEHIPDQRPDLHHGRPAAQARRKPAGPDQSQRRSVRRHPERDARRPGYKQDAIVLVVSNPVDVLTYLAAERLELAGQPGDRPGHAARYDPLSQPDRRAAGGAADAGLGPDPGRAWRQHGADLVERHRRPACRWKSFPAGTPTWPTNCSRAPKARAPK